MARAPRTAVAVVLGASGVLLFGAPAAYAAPPVALTSGLLTITLAPASASLTTTGSTTSGNLGTTTVTDGRVGATGYNVSVTSNGFDLVGPPVTSSPTTHIPSSAATTRATATTGGTASSTAAAALPASPLFHLSYPGAVLSLDLISTYTLSLTIAVPAQAAPGRYTGTVTQTLV
jgi:hypothetical protein